MVKILVSMILATLTLSIAHAENKTCAVKGMHCEGCTEMVQGKVCGDKYSECSVKITDANKEMGEIHLVTKDTAAKIDEKAVGAQVKDAGYSLQKCKATAAAKNEAKAKG